MSDVQQACLTALGDGPMTIADLAEQTGYEAAQVGQAMQALKLAGAVYSGRGGWRPVDEAGETPRLAAAQVVVHQQTDAAAAPEDAPAARRKPRKTRGKRPAKLATVSQLGVPAAAALPALRPEGSCHFAIGEAGELFVTKDDASKFASFSPEETARLAAFLERYRAMLPVAKVAA